VVRYLQSVQEKMISYKEKRRRTIAAGEPMGDSGPKRGFFGKRYFRGTNQ
jgi:hypothetical protein